MNFPEVWNLKGKHKAINLETVKSKEDVASKITSKMGISQMISILTPETSISELEHVINQSDYYYCEDFNLDEVLTRNFINGFLKCGSFSCIPLEYNQHKDSFSISKNNLFLHLHKESLYSIRGVELSGLKSRSDGDFIDFEIDMLNEKIDFSKLKEELKDVFRGVAVNFMWNSSSNDICVSSIAKYFSDLSHNVKLCRNKLLINSEYGLKFPKITPEDDLCRFLEVSEYVGMVLLGCSVEENDLSSYQLPEDCIDIGRGKVIHSKGFLTQASVSQLIDEIRRILQENPSFPWIALSIIFYCDHDPKFLIIAQDKIHSL